MRARGGSDVNLNSENWSVVKAALVAGMYPNLVHINRKTSVLSSAREKKVHFHPTSILSQTKFSEVGQPAHRALDSFCTVLLLMYVRECMGDKHLYQMTDEPQREGYLS